MNSPSTASAQPVAKHADPLTDDAICGDWRVLQRKRGHRYSLDDVATAWEAARARPEAQSYADIGCGIGSVLLMVRYKLGPRARVAGVEAQRISHHLAQRNLSRNGVQARLALGDLRSPHLAGVLGAPFDLVTGTPPYMPLHSATPSSDSQRAHARIEMRGGVEDYLHAAAPLLADEGRFVVCCDARKPERALEGGAAVGLFALRRRDVVPRAGKKGALFTVWTFGRQDAPLVVEPPLVARDEGGGRTEAAHELRRFFGLMPNVSEPASP